MIRREKGANAGGVKLASLSLALGVALAAPSARAEEPKPTLSLGVSANADGAWTMVLTNVGDRPQRVHADVRLLWFEVIGAPTAPDGKHPQRARAYPRGKLPVCRVPAELRPLEGDRSRQVVLAPGERWEAPFDPVLFCGAMKLDGELGAGALVYPSYGYPTPPRPKWKKPSKEEEAERPVIAEVIGAPAGPATSLVEGPGALVVAPVPEGSAAKPPEAPPSGSKPADAPPPGSKPSDAPAAPEAPAAVEPVPPVMTLSAAHRGDAARGADVVVAVTLSYVGKRKTSVHVRPDDLEFEVVAPDGERHACSRRSGIRGPARDFFETWRPRAKRSFSTRVFEVCGGGVFDRPGVYSIRPTLVLHEAGEEYSLQSLVARATVDHDVRVRVRTGKRPFLDAPARPAGVAPPPSP